MHRGVQRRDDVARSEDRVLAGIDTAVAADRDPRRRPRVGHRARSDLHMRLNDAATVYVPETQMIDDVRTLGLTSPPIRARSTTRSRSTEPRTRPTVRATYRLAEDRRREDPPGKYFVDGQGHAKYLVDPGINGTHSVRPDGTRVTKFAAPKAALMSYIMGIYSAGCRGGSCLWRDDRARAGEMSMVPSLAFAVGLYLPLSSSTPILIGGVARWLVDRYTRQKNADKKLTEEELTAEETRARAFSWRRVTSRAARSPAS